MAPVFSRSLIISLGKTVSCWVSPFTECLKTHAKLHPDGKTGSFSTHLPGSILHHRKFLAFLYMLASEITIGKYKLKSETAVIENKPCWEKKWQWPISTFRMIRSERWPGLKESLMHPVIFQIKKLILKEEKGIVPLEVAVHGRVGTRTYHRWLPSSFHFNALLVPQPQSACFCLRAFASTAFYICNNLTPDIALPQSAALFRSLLRCPLLGEHLVYSNSLCLSLCSLHMLLSS